MEKGSVRRIYLSPKRIFYPLIYPLIGKGL